MTKSTLSEALSEGKLHTALRILQQESQLDTSLTPTSLTKSLKTSRTNLQSARTEFLEQTLPLTLLPSAVLKVSHAGVRDEIRRLVAAICAENVAVPPAGKIGTEIPEGAGLFEEASEQLAICAAAGCEELADAWNEMLPSDMSVESAESLAAAVRDLQLKEEGMLEEAGRLESSIEETRAAAKAALFESVRGALEATEIDLEERMGDCSADDVAVDVLVARGAATKGKVRLQRAEIAAKLYTRESVQAIKRISEAVARRTVEAEGEVEKLEMMLVEYRGLGKEFESIVGEFSRCEGELEEKIWSRSELRAGGS